MVDKQKTERTLKGLMAKAEPPNVKIEAFNIPNFTGVKKFADDRGFFTGGTGGWTDDGGTVRLTTESDKVGIGTTSPNGTLDVHTGDAGAVTPSTNADDLVIENSGNAGISILTPNTSIARIFFGSPADPTGAKIQWSNNDDLFHLGSSKANGEVGINSGNDVEAIRIDASQNATFSAGLILAGALTGAGSGHDQFSDFVAAEHVDWAAESAGTIHITNFAGLQNVVEDTTPELGGEMDAGAHTIGFTQQTATGDGTTTIDWKIGNKFKFTFGTQNDTFTFTAPTNPCNILLMLIQDGTGSRLATWPATVKWPGGSAPTLSTGGAAIDIISFYFDGTNYFGVDSLNFS